MIVAPQPEAVEAGLELVERVGRMPIDVRDPTLGTPDLGVGIATGPAFVGPLRAVDRTLWGVLGDTTNLAARLQALAPELGATIAIDGATHRGAGELARAFVAHADTPIRGRHGRLDVHALPRSPARAEAAASPAEVSS